LDELLILAGDLVFGEYCIDGTLGLAGAAVDALIRIDEVLLVIVGGINAVDRAHGDATGVFHVDARLGDDIGHGLSFPFIARTRSSDADTVTLLSTGY